MRASDARFVPDLVAVRAGEVAALASEYDAAPSANERELRAHDAITGRVHEVAPSLPSRFGALYDDRDALARALSARDHDLARDLERVGARIELDVTLVWRDAAPHRAADASSGREYLLAAAAREREEREAERIVERLVAELAFERALIRQSICPRDGVAATVAVLATRDEEVNVRQRIAAFAERTEAVTVTVYGPVPPYAFVS